MAGIKELPKVTILDFEENSRFAQTGVNGSSVRTDVLWFCTCSADNCMHVDFCINYFLCDWVTQFYVPNVT